MKKQAAGKLMTSVVIVLSLGAMFLIFTQFRARMNAELNTSVVDSLCRNVDAQAAAFQTKLTDQMIMLESQTRYFSDVDLTDYNAMKSTIMSTRGMEAFTSIGVASAAGSTMNYRGKSSGNILLHDYFQRAMSGESAIGAETAVDEFGNEVLTLAVPILKDGKAVGVIYGTFARDALNVLLESVQFSEQSASLLITGSGTILAETSETSFFDGGHKRIQDAIPSFDMTAAVDSEFYSYDYEGQENILVLRPVGFHDWRFGTVVPRSSTVRRKEFPIWTS